MGQTDHARALALFIQAGGPPSGHGTGVWLRRALGVSERVVRDWQYQGFPTYALRALELLERLPVHRWPDAWRHQTPPQSEASPASGPRASD